MGDRILLIEDDRSVRRSIALSLEQEGFEVVEANDAEQGLELLPSADPALVILDVMLPGMNGFDACRAMRQSSAVPVIFLTAKSDMVDVVVGLESGGDDYITKPFIARELVARIRALLRRLKMEHAPRRLTVGNLELDPGAGTVVKDGEPLSLTKTEFELLRTLASRPNMVFTREMLLEQVWGYDYLGDSRLVDVHVRRLRAKIEDDASNAKLIQTVRGYGYKLVAN
jgi:DNA-binding response OmpR family regulator